MGYEKLYGRCFVRVGDYIIPFIQSGSSNCFEISIYGREVNEKNWWSCSFSNSKLLFTADELIKNVETAYPAGSSREVFYTKGKWMCSDEMLGWMKSGIKNAISFEDFVKLNGLKPIFIRTDSGAYEEKIESADDFIRLGTLVNNNMDKAGGYATFVIRTRDALKSKQVSIPGPVIAKLKNSYVVGFGERSIAKSPNIQDAVVFDSVEDAIEKTNGLILRFHPVFLKADNKEKASKKDYVLLNTEGHHKGLLLKRKHGNYVYYTSGIDSAQKYTLKDAEKMSETINGTFNEVNFKPCTAEEYEKFIKEYRYW